MQYIESRWLIPVVILASDRLFEKDLAGGFSSEETCRDLIVKSVLDYQQSAGTNFRNEDIEHAIDYWFEGDINSPVVFSLNKLAKIFLIWQGDCFEVRSALLPEWLSLCNYIDPAWLIAVSYYNYFKDELILSRLKPLFEKQCHLALPRGQMTKTYSDNHVHLTGHGSPTLSLLNFSLYLKNRPKSKNIYWPRRNEHILFESGSLSKDFLPLWLNVISREIIENGKSDGDLKVKALSIDSIYLPGQLDENLMSFVLDMNEDGAKRWLMLCLNSLSKSHDQMVMMSFSRLIRCSNILRSYMLVSGVGLSQFTDHFNFNYRKPINQSNGLNYNNHSLESDLADNSRREFRVGPHVIMTDDRLDPLLLSKMGRLLSLHGKARKSHFVVHFHRGFKFDLNKDDRALPSYRDELLGTIRDFKRFFESATYAQYNIGDKCANLDLRKMIRGFDVSGNENQLPVEIFAPYLRVLRASVISPEFPYGSYMRRPFISVHAGEDYSHVLSGLRAIDETVEFCKMAEGDRLGHALALGVDVNNWAEKQKMVYLTLSDQLDNLVWLYHQAVKIALITDRFTACLALIQQKISRYSSKLYGESVAPEILYDSWLLRRNEPNENASIDDVEVKEWMPDKDLIGVDGSQAVEKWQQYLNRTNVCASPYNCIVAIEFERNRLGLIDESNLLETITDLELELYSAVQDFLLEKYSRLELVIEVCPTSNITIGRFSSYQEHPIYRWNPPIDTWLDVGSVFNIYGLRKGPMAVCINTDDAGLMPTTIENEHRVLKATAIKSLNVPSLQAESWIDSIRKKGNEIFELNHLEWENQL